MNAGMFAYLVPIPICGACGHELLHIDDAGYNAARKKGIVQVICRHQECANYDKPLEFNLPTEELRPTTDPKIIAQIPAPKLVIMN